MPADIANAVLSTEVVKAMLQRAGDAEGVELLTADVSTLTEGQAVAE